MLKVRDWVNFLALDEDVKCINIRVDNDAPSRKRDISPREAMRDGVWMAAGDCYVKYVSRYCDDSGYVLYI